MIDTLKDLYSVLTKKQKKTLFRLQFLVILMALSEVIGIGVFGPFLALAGNFNLVNEEGMLRDIYIWTELQNPADFIFYVGASVLIIIIAALCSKTGSRNFI